MGDINKDIKIFFIDLDGTTLDTKKGIHHWISDKNLQAIKDMQDQGKHVVISTGRMGDDLKLYMDLTNTDYIIGGNGAIIKNKDGKVLREKKLSIRQGLLILGIAQKHGLVLSPNSTGLVYGVTTKLQKYIVKKLGRKPFSGYTFELHKEYYKFGLLGKTKQKMIEIVEEIKKEVPDVSVVTSSNGWSIEVTHKDATKGIANEYIAEQIYKITNKEETAHVGDTMNDSTAIGHVGRLIVMSNADKYLKEISPYRGPSYKKGGLAEVLYGNYKKIEKK